MTHIIFSTNGKREFAKKLAYEKLVSDKKSVLDFLKEHLTYILDGELYCHGKHLQELSGIARNETWKDKCDILEYWIYDIALDTVEFKDRWVILQEMQEIFKDSKKIKVIDHYLTKSWADIQKLHDQ